MLPWLSRRVFPNVDVVLRRSGDPLVRVAIQQRRHISLESLDKAKGDRERVLILGSGWGGFGLARRLDTRYFQPVIVSPRNYFIFTPLLDSTAVGTLEFRTCMESAHGIRGVPAIRAWATHVDPWARTVGLRGAAEQNARSDVRPSARLAFDLGYDRLAVAVGASTATFGTRGVGAHAFVLKDVVDARRIRRRVVDRVEQAAFPTTRDDEKRRLLHFAVVGGGPTGTQFAAELHDFLTEDVRRRYGGLDRFACITVYDVAPRILSMFEGRLQEYAKDLFKREGIRVRTNHHVLEVAADAIVTKEEGRVPVGAVVWSTGLAPSPFVADALGGEFRLGSGDGGVDGDGKSRRFLMAKDPRGRLAVDRHLRVQVRPADEKGEDTAPTPLNTVFALGDCVQVDEMSLPGTGQVADQESKWLAKSLNNAAKHRQLDDISRQKPFVFHNMGLLSYLGGHKAVFQSGQGELKGWFAWVLWRGAYFTRSVSWRNKILILVYWTLNRIMGRDISRF